MKHLELFLLSMSLMIYSVGIPAEDASLPTSKSAIVAIETNLHKKPTVKSAILVEKTPGESLKIGKRHRAWYFVEDNNYPNAWVKMLAVQLAVEPRRAGELGVVSLFESMTTKPTASTAVRGFDQHAFDQVTPNKARLTPLNTFKPSESELNRFIADGKLIAAEVPNE